MLRFALLLLALPGFFNVTMISESTQKAPEPLLVELYTGPNFTGAMRRVSPGKYFDTSFGVDFTMSQVKSVKIPLGLGVRFYKTIPKKSKDWVDYHPEYAAGNYSAIHPQGIYGRATTYHAMLVYGFSRFYWHTDSRYSSRYAPDPLSHKIKISEGYRPNAWESTNEDQSKGKYNVSIAEEPDGKYFVVQLKPNGSRWIGVDVTCTAL